jgi:hypothetical protein
MISVASPYPGVVSRQGTWQANSRDQPTLLAPEAALLTDALVRIVGYSKKCLAGTVSAGRGPEKAIWEVCTRRLSAALT